MMWRSLSGRPSLRAQREATLAAAEAALRSRVGELTTELQTAGGSLEEALDRR